jgi:hypothetical protein
MLPVAIQVPLPGSYSSAEFADRSAFGPILPPATSTLPSDSSVAVLLVRASVIPPVPDQLGALAETTDEVGAGATDEFDAEGATELVAADGVADRPGVGLGRVKTDPTTATPITAASALPPTSHSRVCWFIFPFLHGVGQANPERRRRVVLSWARAARSTRSASSAGPGSR